MRRFVNLSSLGNRRLQQRNNQVGQQCGNEQQQLGSVSFQNQQQQQVRRLSLSSWVNATQGGASSSGFGSGTGTGKRGETPNASGSGSGGEGTKRRRSSEGNLRKQQQQQGQQIQDMAGSSSSSKNRVSGGVKHDRSSNRFTLDLGNNQVARIEYKPIGKNKIEMYHTEVPSEFRGKGIGRALAKGAFEHCVTDGNNTKLKLTCSYLINYMEKFAEPRHKKLVER